MSKKVLVIDIGNTATEFAVFEGENLQDFLGFFKFPEDLEKAKKSLFSYKNKGLSIDEGMIFSVVPKNDDLVNKLVKEVFDISIPVFDWKGYKLENTNEKIIEPIGADLLADIKEARRTYGGPCLIADFGTITKLIYLDKNGSFEGLSLMPGIETSLKLFSVHTALLPDLEKLEIKNNELGLNTISSMYHGVYTSAVYYVKGVYESLKTKDLKLIITGGNLRYIKEEFKHAIIDPELALKGMNILYREIKK